MPRKKEYRVGFTGTREGLTFLQRRTLKELVKRITEGSDVLEHDIVFLHGSAVGADSSFHVMCLGHRREVYPSTRTKKVLSGMKTIVRPARPSLERNRNIVDSSDMVIACPKKDAEGGGTVFTMGYAIETGVRLVVILYDGSMHG